MKKILEPARAIDVVRADTDHAAETKAWRKRLDALQSRASGVSH